MKTKLSAIIMIILTTFLTSVAQIFYKAGAAKLSFDLVSLVTNYDILIGLFLYAAGAAIMIIAFKGGDLTVLYPLFSTSYIWVALMSFFIFEESLNIYRWMGIMVIMTGIILISTYKQKEAVHLTEPV
jgi:uncharacterized membrane protein